jgi:hypothetical protein
MKPSTLFPAALFAGTALLAIVALAQNGKNAPAAEEHSPVGYSDTPVIPGQKWKVHDIDRPHPRVVTPGAHYGDPPSDAIVLFNGKDLSKWVEMGKRQNAGKMIAPTWKVENGYTECVPRVGDIATKEKFGDMQLHVEWASPVQIQGDSQNRGNSGILLMSRYEVQVLDSWNNKTYADGQAGAVYGWWPPLVNATRKPGEWQTYDIMFEAPRWEGKKLLKPAYVTVFHNGIFVQNHTEIGGPMAHRIVRSYEPHGPEEPLMLQNHNTKVRYRNIWARKIMPRDSTTD